MSSYQYLECHDNHPHNNHPHRHHNLVDNVLDYQDTVYWEGDGAAAFDAASGDAFDFADDYKDNSSHHDGLMYHSPLALMEHCNNCLHYNHNMEQ